MQMSARLDAVTVQRRGVAILGPVTHDLAPVGITIVLGPNGAGKTTFLKVLHGVERVSSGRVTWSVGHDEARQSQAYVFQSPIMLRRTVGQNLAYPLQLIGVPKAEIAFKVQEWSEKTGLAQVLHLPASRLSGGEKQKLALGRALIRDPNVVFLDEPCANLDGHATREIEALLLDACNAGTRIIMTTHNLGQAQRLAHSVLFFLRGKLHEQADASKFFAGPDTPEAAAFLKGDIVE